MSGQHSGQAPHLSCSECRERLQDYIDDGLEKRESLRVFLHVRDCEACGAELAALEGLIARLERLPRREAPADFDARILAAVPYDSYRAMARLRAPRVPVFLERETLPGWLRHAATRLGGLGVAAAGGAVWLAAGSDAGLIALAIGLLPQTVVSLQAAGRGLAQAFGRAEEGA